MAILQPLIDLASVCFAHGVRHVIVSPGSRSAALTLAFVRHRGFQMHTCMDERSAAFIGLGIAQQLNMPTVLICTSGSAAYNFAPAVAEAFFQHIPLLVLTADRPKEWQHQLDGQTIYQADIYGRHVKRSFEISPDYGHKDVQWAINRIANEALISASSQPWGPVHINIPIREPFYPQETDAFQPSEHIRVFEKIQTNATLSTELWHQMIEELEDGGSVLIAGGQARYDPELSESLEKISEEWGIPVLGDCISNLNLKTHLISRHDLFLGMENAAELRPDLLITFGLSFLSKEFKQFIRRNPPKQHWHIGETAVLSDPMQVLTKSIPVKPAYFFKELFEQVDYQQFVQNTDFDNVCSNIGKWDAFEARSTTGVAKYLDDLRSLNDLTSVDLLFRYIKSEYQLHVANSMAVRYVNVLLTESVTSELFANRGTSGIDGCVSTAIGAARVNSKPTMLIVGDVAFLYDRNGLLAAPLPDNLKIVVLNNGGGNIFRMIDGPGALPEMEEFFETRHSYTARRTCEDSGITYLSVTDLSSLEETLKQFLQAPKISLIEIFTDPYENERVWKGLKATVKSDLIGNA
ncbi:2-succinyl-5-enolpyruvyl-6-hydroxy-3-cyclohexene-1-carboxylate synthase [Dyadobacter sp. CECT 9623]|uniref:2-succinyl-5-enolpyruvyl-6-hydroxy-3-cyclohexene-1-carboxylate synthase n=1 Tax=Dyadobacter linearis TaxID=2823330 RepID=A0ABN7R4T1_9BACT|nr:2-succinyl-5-enolpyruvyl-6-hydroxy-3-cyclohexene-1-carboxylic-acid synthase [Dyadobacter sp. CECT 9623]CAG5069126.1 2-succinyl-5-enolpyruvyl-6-hydroxy-3-cyclohexene-1-carboxylate synthase [Dyadobacter sp. CECT 9623]